MSDGTNLLELLRLYNECHPSIIQEQKSSDPSPTHNTSGHLFTTPVTCARVFRVSPFLTRFTEMCLAVSVLFNKACFWRENLGVFPAMVY